MSKPQGRAQRLRSLLDQLRVAGVAVVLFLGSLVVPALPRIVTNALTDPLLEYQENGRTADVRARDGCLHFHRDSPPRGSDVSLTYCPARIPEGADGWAPQFRDYYVVDASGRTVTEVVQFGVVPDPVARIRSTLPGGQVVEAATRRVADLQHPVVLLHLEGVALPVDLAEAGGRRVFVRLQMFDSAGREVPVV